MKVIQKLFGRGSVRHVTLYGKPGCHLCDDAREILERLSTRYPLVLDEVDIRSDPALYRLYDIRIPVIVIDGKVGLEAPITENSLRSALRTAARQR